MDSMYMGWFVKTGVVIMFSLENVFNDEALKYFSRDNDLNEISRIKWMFLLYISQPLPAYWHNI